MKVEQVVILENETLLRGFRHLEGVDKRSYCVWKIKDNDFEEEMVTKKKKFCYFTLLINVHIDFVISFSESSA